jgi:general secretion pathway protein K
MRRREEQGVALLSVLLLVAVMSVMAVTVLDEIRFGVRRAANAEAVGQARWYALGAEALARGRIRTLLSTDARASGWSGQAASFPVDDGLIQARLSDGGNCFNLNSVVQGPPEGLRRNDVGVRQFVNLARSLGFVGRQADSLAAAVVDWLDADPLRESGGAEDETYVDYRTAGTLIAERSELRAIRGFDAEVYTRLKPYVCALPNATLAPINVNTLTEDQAPLVAMLTEEPLPLAAARRVIAARPVGGWGKEDFHSHPVFQQAALTDEAIGQLTDQPTYFRLETEVTYADAEVIGSALLMFDRDLGRVVVVARRWGPEE